MTEILLLGTFHFMESSFDFYTDKVQDELDHLTKKLLEFHPDTVAVEAAMHQQEVVSESYQKFNLKDLRNPEKMRSETLGSIHMFGQTCPITYNNEAIQIGYKLGKLLNLDDIYAIDEDIDLGESATKLMPFLTDTINELNKNTNRHEKDSIIELYKYYNSAKWSKLNHNIYIRANAIKLDGFYTGVEMNTKWYERNLKIFANIQQLAEKSKKLFILYGAGHLQLLKDFINADNNLHLVDVYQYL